MLQRQITIVLVSRNYNEICLSSASPDRRYLLLEISLRNWHLHATEITRPIQPSANAFLIICMLGNFACVCRLLIFIFKINFFKQLHVFQAYHQIRLPSSLDPESRLQRLSELTRQSRRWFAVCFLLTHFR